MQLKLLLALGTFFTGGGLAGTALIPTTPQDFLLPGTPPASVNEMTFQESINCAMCHGAYDLEVSPFDTWQGSLMGLAAEDPLFWAQMSTANQDLEGVGAFCLRCHVPAMVVSGNVEDPYGGTMNYLDGDGVTCTICHSMVDPIYKPGISPERDVRVLQQLEGGAPTEYGNAMFVLDPEAHRRGPRGDTLPPHVMVESPFHRSGDFCGTCHDVGNVGVERQEDGTYQYNALDTPTGKSMPDLFPLERTYTEWKLSSFANGGVDMGGRFGGDGVTVVESCQDCHMPRTSGRMAIQGIVRPDVASHEFAGASSWVLRMIARYALYTGETRVNQAAVQRGILKAEEMLRKAASLELSVQDGQLVTRVINESGHKIPTGHIEGRRIWVNVRFFDDAGTFIDERGAYNPFSADLHGHDTTVYEMHVGLSPSAAAATGYPAGQTTHMVLANTIEKDTRIPPRGFKNLAFERAGAPVVGMTIADGEHWHDTFYDVPANAASAKVAVFYQTVTREYIEALRDANHTDHWGTTIYRLWLATDMGPPVLMVEDEIDLP